MVRNETQFSGVSFMTILTLAEVQAVGEIQPNSLILGDCLEVMEYIEDKSIDMILCDLPYG